MPLTQKQVDMVEFVLAFIQEHGRRPQNKEIAEHFNLSSVGSVSSMLKSANKNLGICPYCQRPNEKTY